MPTNTFTLEEAYGTPTEEKEFPTLVPAKRSAVPSTSGEAFIPGFTEDNPLPKDSGLFNIIKGAADKYRVPEEIALAIAQQESGYDPKIENEIGAKGLWQFIDATSSALGIDPFDPAQSSDAAMKEFAQQAEKKGVEWAIAHHFAGPDPKQHGPKTKQYVKSIMDRAERIAQALELDGVRTNLIGQEVPDDLNPQKLTKVEPGQTFSLEEAYGPVGGAPIQAGPDAGFIDNTLDAFSDAGKAVYNSIKDRITRPDRVQRITRSPEEIEFMVDEAMQEPASFLESGGFESDTDRRERLRREFSRPVPMSSEEDALKFQQERLQKQQEESEKYSRIKDMPPWQQFLNTLDNPAKLILGESLPANFLSFISNVPEQERLKYRELQKKMMRLRIINNPDQFPAEAVEAATAAEQRVEDKQDPTIREQWNALKESAFDNPGMFAGQLVNALIADPEMLAVPVGFGAKPIQAARMTTTGAETSSKVIKLADKILDTGALGATMNLGITLTDQLANNTHLSSKELAFSAAAGALVGGALGGIFSRGARAKIRSLDDAKAKGELESILRDQAAYEVEVERAARGEFDPSVTTEMQQRIQDMLGIKSKTDRNKWIAQRRKEVKETFRNEEDYADYLAFKAEERILRTEQIASERAAREAAAAKQQAASEAGTAVDSTPQTPQGPSPGEIFRALRKPGHLRTAEDLLLIKSIPRGQTGAADPKTLARLAAAGGIAAGAYGLAPEDKKISTALLGGLAGLLIPGGGRVLSRMRQSGAVSMDGMLPGAAELVKEGKLKPDVDAAKIRADEARVLDLARQGDQAAFKKIYEDNFPRIARYVSTYLREAGPKLGIDAEDVAQDVFVQFFNGLDNFKADSAVYTYLQAIARNKALNEIQRSKTQRGGGEFKTTSMYNAGDDLGAGDAAAGHIMEGGEKSLIKGSVEEASADFESPEFNAMYAEAQDQMLRAIQKLPESQRHILLLNRVEGIPPAEIAKQLNVPEGTVKVYLKRAVDSVTEAIGKDFNATKITAGADAPILTKRGRGRPRKIIGGIDSDLLVRAGVGAGVAVAAATAGAKMFPKDPKKGALAGVILAGLGVLGHGFGVGSRGRLGGLSRISQEGAIKLKGGNWDEFAVGKLNPGVFVEEVPKAIQRYLNRYAGTKEDPLNNLTLPDGDRWEDLMDKAITRVGKDSYGGDVYSIRAPGINSDGSRAMEKIRSYMDHVGDYLRTLPKDEVRKMDFVRMVKETKRWDVENAKKMAKARAKSMEGMPVYKEYPDGFKWVQLKRPGEFAQESDVMGHSVRGYEPPKYIPKSEEFDTGEFYDLPAFDEARATNEGILNPEWVEGALGGHPDYGFGGYNAIKNGQVEIYSLRSPDGMSHATIEVKFSPDRSAKGIMQIKGKQNAKPADKYIPYIQDFVKSDKWSVVDDLQNADMIETPDGYQVDMSVRGPKGQRGEVDPRLLKLGAVAALGTGAYAFLESENQKLAATIGALGGLALFSRGRGGESLGKGLVRTIDKGLGATSTRLMNISRPLWWRTMEHYRAVLRDTHKYMKDADPFLVSLEHLPKEQKDFVTRAILTGNPGVATRMIEAIGNSELLAGWKKVRTVLDSLGDQLVHLKRFKNREVDYFPRIVIDYPGLLKALGKEKGDFLNKIIDDANKNAIRARGTELTELERSLVINKALMSEPRLGGQPGFAKDRTVREITPELQKFYATPTESLHSYIRSAVEDIERAKFFGKDLEVVQKGGKEYTNTDKSVGKLVENLRKRGKITEEQEVELSSMLKSLFLNGEKIPNEIVQKAKNLSYAGLLGNPVSATSQLGDAIIQTYIQGIRPTISSVVRSMTGRKFVSMKEFGLADHLAEEFVNTETTAKFLRKVFKAGLFAQLDAFGKNVGLNAAISNFGRMVKTDRGLQKLHSKYGDVLQPQEFQQLVKDLQKGEVTDLVRSVAFAELSRTQPITRLEMPQAYLDNPNGRLLYQFKTFMLKQMDVVRRDAYNEIKKGNVAKGIKNLVGFTTALGIAGATTAQIQEWIKGVASSVIFGRDLEIDPIEFKDIPMNMLKTFGMSEYILNHMLGVSKEEAQHRRDAGDTSARAIDAAPFTTLWENTLMPAPIKMAEDAVTGEPIALRYIPIIGPILLDEYKKRKAEEAS